MKVLNDMKVGSKLFFLASVLILFIVVVAGLGMYATNKINSQCSEMYDVDMQGITNVKDGKAALIASGRALSNLALAMTQEENATHIKGYELHAALAEKNMTAALQIFVSKEGRDKGQQALNKIKELQAKQREIIPLLQNLDSTRESMAAALAQTRVINDAVGVLLEEVNAITMAEAEKRNVDTDVLYDQAKLASGSALSIAVLLGILLALAIRKAIAAPLSEVCRKAELVVGGDLAQDFSLQRKDELGGLSVSLDAMVKNLRERIAEAEQKTEEAAEQTRRAHAAMEEANQAKAKAEAGQQAILQAAVEVEQVVSRLSAATEELSAQVEESSRGTDQQRDRVASSATAMEEMNSTVLEVARNAAVASEGSERARDKARQGEDIVSESVKAIGMVQADTQTLKVNMEDLGKQAEAIGTIMTVISDIADQTNLLALNAAIEAARAGEAGRGFAVVADEVRKLAEKTMTATKEVGDAISGIQQGTRRSIDAVERTTGNLASTTDLVKKSGGSLAEIVDESVHTADQVRSIATAAEEQSAASEEITRSLEEINRMAGETAFAMQQSAMAVSELSQQSQELQTLVNNLRADQA